MCKSRAKDGVEVLQMHFHVIQIGITTGKKNNGGISLVDILAAIY